MYKIYAISDGSGRTAGLALQAALEAVSNLS